jgi:hypothetical protein
MSRYPNSGQNQNIRIANESFEKVAKFKYSGTNFSSYAVWVRNLVSHFEGEHRLRVFEKRVLRKIFGPTR